MLKKDQVLGIQFALFSSGSLWSRYAPILDTKAEGALIFRLPDFFELQAIPYMLRFPLIAVCCNHPIANDHRYDFARESNGRDAPVSIHWVEE